MIVWLACGYFSIAILLYFAFSARCKKNAVFKPPSKRWAFYALSFTWGLPNVLLGSIAALFLVISDKRPVRYGWEWCFEIDGIDWGLELGIFFIAPKNGGEHIRMHEHGHGIQNIYLGIFTPVTVSLPSVMRYWYRRIKESKGSGCKKAYDDIWFERSATESGAAFIGGVGQTVLNKREER